MKAVILAAGMGKRIRSSIKTPKAFIRINGKPIIHYSLKNLKKAGIKDVTIVIGYMGSFFKQEIGPSFEGININYVLNENYNNTGSMHSLSQTEGLIDSDILLLESDLLYELKAIIELISSPHPDLILVAPISGSNDEVFICMDDFNFITNLGKDIHNKEEAKGELVGITKLSLNFLKKLFKIAKKDYRNNKMEKDYEKVIFNLSSMYPIKCLFIRDLIWIEIDKMKDLDKAKKIIFPKIKRSIENE